MIIEFKTNFILIKIHFYKNCKNIKRSLPLLYLNDTFSFMKYFIDLGRIQTRENKKKSIAKNRLNAHQ